jgi:hypothetical protein
MRITIRLPAKLAADLRAHLRVRSTRLSDFVRHAIAEKLERELTGRLSAYDFGKHLFGKHGSGRRDLSINRKAILNEALVARDRR